MKILAVDDEYNQLKLLEMSIRKAVPDCALFCFDNSMEALQWAKDNNPDVVFCDIQMPVMTGIALAKELKKRNAKVNIVFVTGYYADYAAEAVSMHFSGYLHKPISEEKVCREMENLRYPLPTPASEAKLKVRCFGNFEVYAQNQPLHFSRSKTKELLAYLIDRHGASSTCGEISAVIYDNNSSEQNNRNDLRKCAADLKNVLRQVGAPDVFIKGFNAYCVDTSKISCDFYDWEKGEAYAVRAFRGEYMRQYSWAEGTLGNIMSTRI